MLLGIIGGMGPHATICFLQRLLECTPIINEQNHIPYLLISTPEIPDRSKSILSNNQQTIQTIREKLAYNAKLLERSNVTQIVMICNTAHYWEDDIRDAISIPFISIIEETCKYLTDNSMNNVCIMSTLATKQSGMYDRYLTGIDFAYPNNKQQNKITNAIYMIKCKKCSEATNILREVVDSLKSEGFEYFVVACTELPIVLNGPEFVNPSSILVKRILELYKN